MMSEWARRITRFGGTALWVLTAAIVLGGLAPAAIAQEAAAPAISKPPEELLKLDRLVALQIAHARDAESQSAGELRKLSDAQQLQAQGDNLIKQGDYRSAEKSLMQAESIVRGISP